MTESNDFNLKSEQCPVCGITRLNNTFYWSNTKTATTPDEVFSKVCMRVEKKGCINSTGKHVQGLGFGESEYDKLVMDATKNPSGEPDFLQMARDLRKQYNIE